MRKCLLALVPACAYAPHSFVDLGTEFPGARFTTACLDVSVARGQDALAQGALVQYTFGNRCAHAVTVDLASVRVTGDGQLLRAYDPKGEIKPLSIDAYWQGKELIEYRGEASALCVEVSGIEAEARTAERWVCAS
jgi:hypothetical protein